MMVPVAILGAEKKDNFEGVVPGALNHENMKLGFGFVEASSEVRSVPCPGFQHVSERWQPQPTGSKLPAAAWCDPNESRSRRTGEGPRPSERCCKVLISSDVAQDSQYALLGHSSIDRPVPVALRI